MRPMKEGLNGTRQELVNMGGPPSLPLMICTLSTYVYCIHYTCTAVMKIRIRRIRMFLGLPDPDPYQLVRGTDPAPKPSTIKQKNLHSSVL
jgi:hypothetical protein